MMKAVLAGAAAVAVAAAVIVVGGVALLGGGAGSPPQGQPTCQPISGADGAAVAVAVAGDVAGLTPDQLANARSIAGVALGRNTGRLGVRVAMVTAWTESTLVNVDYGDMMGPVVNGQRTMSSSRGLFQQLAAWGPLADRTDPVKAAGMFFDGGQSGQPGLLDVADWDSLTVPLAAQAVQRSEFADGSNYARNLPFTDAIVSSLLAGQTVPEGPPAVTPAPGLGATPSANMNLGTAAPSSATACAAVVGTGALPGTVVADGVDVTIPDDPHVAAELRGQTVTAPSDGVAHGIAAGLSALGLPYVWGGGGDGTGPNDGCARGGGSLNSCEGLSGFDCSGLTAYVAVQGGYQSPGENSGAQRAGGAVPWGQGLPGDIIGFPGHVAINLGVFDGAVYILEASTVGVPVHVVKLTRTDHDPSMYRYWG